MTIYIKNGGAHFRADVTATWARRHDNGALISCGLTVGVDLTDQSFRRLLASDRVTPVTYDQWNHSGCLSSCVLRGDAACRW